MKWLKESNRLKHLLWGGVMAFFVIILNTILGGILGAIISTSVTTFLVATALEYKDKAHGGAFDWLDVLATLIGGAIGQLVFILIYLIFM